MSSNASHVTEPNMTTGTSVWLAPDTCQPDWTSTGAQKRRAGLVLTSLFVWQQCIERQQREMP